MKFAIRDDDTSYFTQPIELERVYEFVKNGKISLSVVPYTINKHKDCVFPYGLDIKDGFYNIEDNKELIEYLRKNRDRYDILLHGYSHQYKMENDKWIPELVWKDYETILNQLSEAKQMLEKIFEREVSIAVAPNNQISSSAIRVIEELGMDYSGIIQHFDRDIDCKYLYNYIKRWLYRATKRIAYGGILHYSNHNELVAYALDSYDRLVYEYNECKKIDAPFVVYTHYWKLLRDQFQRELLEKIYAYAINDGAELIGLSQCFNR